MPKASSNTAPPTLVREQKPALVELSEIPKWYRVLDPLSSYYFHPQVAPKGFHKIPARSAGPFFPGRQYSEIWGYELGTGYLTQTPCDQFAPDGTVCPNVVYPGKQLNENQAVRLMSIAHRPTNVVEKVVSPDGSGHTTMRARLACGDPVAMFVFVDAGHRPVGIVSVDEECAQWSFVPAPKDAWEGLACTNENEQRILLQLCAELDFDSCSSTKAARSYADDARNRRPPTREEQAALQQALLTLLLKDWPNIDEDRALDSTSAFEQQELCAWYVRSAAVARGLYQGSMSWGFSGLGFEDEETHHAIGFQDFEECVDKFPRCNGSIRDGRACIARHLEELWNQDETCHLGCVWGVSVPTPHVDKARKPR
jgi:hypothetical protein